MLQLRQISKTYGTGTSAVRALREVSIDFRPCEFVSIQGPSGCGKTTLLNLIGGLDQYTDGDLWIDGTSTKTYTAADWDTYRNHRVGFVFQSYNLIAHQSVLSNVELELTLSGVPRAERRRRAAEALRKVGLGDCLHKKPSQLSGGQMQRVAIARAIVNDPDMILADEPTGALDSNTSIQVMDILKEISKDRLVIMVTHNSELAEQYSTRILHLLDGRVVDDSDPFVTPETEAPPAEGKKRREKHPSMSVVTAFSLSLNNLLTKKTRTLLTSLAGSIGIIGIALILALSGGTTAYIDRMQTDTLSAYPLQLDRSTVNLTALLTDLVTTTANGESIADRDRNLVYTNHAMSDLMATMSKDIAMNDLGAFKDFLENDPTYGAVFADPLVVSDVRYQYALPIDIYATTAEGRAVQVNPNHMLQDMLQIMGVNIGGEDAMSSLSSMYRFDTWVEMLDNREMLESQYRLMDEETMRWPTAYDEIVIVINPNNELTDITLYSLGLKDPAEFDEMIRKLATGETMDPIDETTYTFDALMDLRYRLVLPSDRYVYDEATGTYKDMSGDADYMATVMEKAPELKVVGLVEARDPAITTAIDGTIGYTRALSEWVMTTVNEQALVQAQLASTGVNLLDGLAFDVGQYDGLTVAERAELFRAYAADGMSPYDKQRAFLELLSAMDHDERMAVVNALPEEARQALSTEPFDAMSEQALIDYVLDNFTRYKTAYRYIVLDLIEQAMPHLTPEQQETFREYVDSMTEEELLELVLSQTGDDPGEDGMTAEEKRALWSQYLLGLDRGVLVSYAVAIDTERSIDHLGNAGIPPAQMATVFDAYLQQMTDAQVVSELYDSYMPTRLSDQSYEEVLTALGYADPDKPDRIYIYAAGFEEKERLQEIIEVYNATARLEGRPGDVIQYTDMVGTMMVFLSDLVNALSYLLIAIIGISLIVSTLMIGIITYVSVLERKKEIGVLRAMGASKRDIARVFNAETAIIGFAAGLFGILIALLLCIPVNLIVHSLTGITAFRATLAVPAAVLLVTVNITLTLLAGLIPAIAAARKDPVVALRSE